MVGVVVWKNKAQTFIDLVEVVGDDGENLDNIFLKDMERTKQITAIGKLFKVYGSKRVVLLDFIKCSRSIDVAEKTSCFHDIEKYIQRERISGHEADEVRRYDRRARARKGTPCFQARDSPPTEEEIIAIVSPSVVVPAPNPRIRVREEDVEITSPILNCAQNQIGTDVRRFVRRRIIAETPN